MEKKIIVLVEDNPNDEALTLRALKKNNIANEIVVTRDGAEAIDFLFGQGAYIGRDRDQVISVVLLDLKLPKVDGLEVLKKLRENRKTRLLPVVVLTSSKEEQDMIRSYSLGANSYIRKPVDFTQFIEAVRQLGLYWLVLNETPPREG
jgi:CheY-like chemotaxis protein